MGDNLHFVILFFSSSKSANVLLHLVTFVRQIFVSLLFVFVICYFFLGYIFRQEYIQVNYAFLKFPRMYQITCIVKHTYLRRPVLIMLSSYGNLLLLQPLVHVSYMFTCLLPLWEPLHLTLGCHERPQGTVERGITSIRCQLLEFCDIYFLSRHLLVVTRSFYRASGIRHHIKSLKVYFMPSSGACHKVSDGSCLWNNWVNIR